MQEFVREIGGYKVAELAEAVSNRWAFKFTVSKVRSRKRNPVPTSSSAACADTIVVYPGLARHGRY